MGWGQLGDLLIVGLPFPFNFWFASFARANSGGEKKCASTCACMHVRVSIRTLNTHLKSAWCCQPYQQRDAAGMLGKETLESRGWDGAAPSCLIPPAKCKHVMAKGRQLLASEHLAPMRRKLLSVWGAECVSVRYGDTTTVVWRYSQLSRSLSDLLLPDATLSCSLYFSFWLPCVLSFNCVEGVFPEMKERKIVSLALGKRERQHKSYSKSLFT